MKSFNDWLTEKDKELVEKYVGFDKLEKKVAAKGKAKNSKAVAAAIGRKKYGKAKFQKAAAKGKKLRGAKLKAKKKG